MKNTKFALLLITLFCSFQTFAWGQTGHRVTAAIAEHYLSAQAKAVINTLLINEDLAEASTFADEMRSNPSEFWQKTATPWHYVNVHEGKTYEQMKIPEEGDAVTALTLFSKQLTSEKSSFQDKQIALRFIIHIIADLHQPLHSGTDIDEGGNKINVVFFKQETNLHTVWDSELIDRQLLSYTEWTNRLQAKISHKQFHLWQQIDPKVWIAESAEIRQSIYPKTNKELSWNYQYQNIPIIKKRLQMGGIRLAAYLNDLFAHECDC